MAPSNCVDGFLGGYSYSGVTGCVAAWPPPLIDHTLPLALAYALYNITPPATQSSPKVHLIKSVMKSIAQQGKTARRISFFPVTSCQIKDTANKKIIKLCNYCIY